MPAFATTPASLTEAQDNWGFGTCGYFMRFRNPLQTRDRYVAVTSGSVIALTDQVVLVVRRDVFRILV